MPTNPLFRRDPMLRYAIALGFELKPGKRHWHAVHPNGGMTIIPFGRKRPPRAERNIQASLRRAAFQPAPTTTP